LGDEIKKTKKSISPCKGTKRTKLRSRVRGSTLAERKCYKEGSGFGKNKIETKKKEKKQQTTSKQQL